MKKMKCVVSLLCCAAMTAALMTGCAKTETKTTEAAAEAQATEKAEGAGKEESAAKTDEAKTEEKAKAGTVTKIAILLPGFITDKSWNQGAYEGLKELESQGYEIAYTEDVQAADMESTFRSYCEEGYEFVIGHGVQY
ncbi:MAG: BMP family ABC transporter substrate-binding protein, partial [Clostridiaceae bacterium]|nr:BMP family ABC transporter substrate-binding protein [Clostridiaceae bacterium]